MPYGLVTPGQARVGYGYPKPPAGGGGGALAMSAAYQCSTAAAGNGWDSNATTKTITSVANAAGDLLVAYTGGESNDLTFGTPTGTGVTFVQKLLASPTTASRGTSAYWTGVTAAGGSGWTLTETATGSDYWGVGVARWANANGTGATAKTDSGSQSGLTWYFPLTLTTTAANSGIMFIALDWSGIANASRTYPAINGFTPAAGGTGELTYFNDTAQYTAYAVYYPDAGAIGAKALGVNGSGYGGPGGNSCAAIEILKATGGGAGYNEALNCNGFQML